MLLMLKKLLFIQRYHWNNEKASVGKDVVTIVYTQQKIKLKQNSLQKNLKNSYKSIRIRHVRQIFNSQKICPAGVV